MGESDHDLLRQYARDGSQAAFTELVRRHVDLVYSAACRLVKSSALAEEIAQSVFVDLSRNAARIKSATPLVAWLHVVTRRTAIDTIRRESRRQAREQTAMIIAAMKPPSSDWSGVEPLLDDAVESLPEPDRAAILLRFFESKSLREVGAALGTSDDAAQKRVARALEQLRAFFLRRGIAVTAAGLVTDLSAHAIQSAPAALSASVSAATAAASVAALSTATNATEIIVMSTFQKALCGTTLALTLGAGVFEARIAFNQRSELIAMQQSTDSLVAEARSARLTGESTTRALDAARATLASARSGAGPDSPEDDALASAMKAWLGRVYLLKQSLVQNPELSIPELSLLPEQAWIAVAQDAQLETEEQIHAVLAKIRGIAENSIANQLGPALRAYVEANDGQLPAQTSELAPFFKPPVDPGVLQRYDMVRSGKLSEIPMRESQGNLIVQKSPVDPNRDSIWRVGTNAFSSESAAGYAVREAQREFARANSGVRATTPEDLLPYLIWPVSFAKVSEQMKGQ
ncbi:MAG: sigma-70 family RNA polymerase sigma factor [Opitutaceae bacterium]